jgi:Protein of unknown function (DUF3617)
MRFPAVLAALALAGVTTTSAALAVNLPERKPGLWVVATSSPDSNLPSHEVRMCIDSSTDAMMSSAGTNAMNGACGKNEVKRDGAVVTVVSICRMGDVQATTRAVIHFSGDTAYHSDINTTFNPPMMGRSTATVSQDGKWTGACPADMQPGDIVMANGMRMNIKTMMGGPHKTDE